MRVIDGLRVTVIGDLAKRARVSGVVSVPSHVIGEASLGDVVFIFFHEKDVRVNFFSDTPIQTKEIEYLP